MSSDSNLNALRTMAIVPESKGPIDFGIEPFSEIVRNTSDLISGPKLSENCSIQSDVLQFRHSFGFNCQRLFNLCLLVPDVLVFASGNLIHFLRISTQTTTTRRCSTGGGIGFITKNPNPDYNFLTVAENGPTPPIICYRYPQMDVIALCEGGSVAGYTYVDYSADGELLVSQSAAPDFMITLWKWKSGSVLLRSRSFQNTVYRVLFSLHVPGQLTTCGIGHIKFWNICETFTGLKLVGEHGRFGKTEICDIAGALSMPLGSTVSGSEWGNLLVWEEGLIKFEVCRKNRKNCHRGSITEMYLRNGELMTVGMDGYVRIWFWETVELADPPDDDLFVEIEPIYEYRIGDAASECSLHAMVKRDSDSWWWYAQDANGAIWMADISPQDVPQPSQRLFRCHSGAVVSLVACPFDTFIATFGDDGRLHVYDYVAQKLVYHEQFASKGRCMLWLPIATEPSGVALLLGFDDGVVRLISLDLQQMRRLSTDRVNDVKLLHLLQVWKPHRMALTTMSLNSDSSILVTGSEDSTLFVHQVLQQEPFVRFVAIGYIEVPSAATAFNWKPDALTTLIVGCLHGEVLKMDVPAVPSSDQKLSYRLHDIEFEQFMFESKKSQLRREIYLENMERLKLEKRNRKMRELKRLRNENPDIKIDEDAFLADSDSEEELEPLYIPPIRNRVLWLMYTPENTIWLSMGQYDCGYVYEFDFESDDAMKCTPIMDAEDLEINCYLYFDKFLVLGMQDGSIRINRVRQNHRDLSDYWSLTMHDNANGVIHDMCVSYDRQYMFSSGADGNIFSYKWNIPIQSAHQPHKLVPVPLPTSKIMDIIEPLALSLEEQKQKNNKDVRAKIANDRKAKVVAIIEEHKKTFFELMSRNEKLVPTQQIDRSEMGLDSRISSNLQASLKERAQLVKRKLAFNLERNRLLVHKVRQYFIEPLEDLVTEVHAMLTSTCVRSFRINFLGDEFEELIQMVKDMIQFELDSKRVVQIVGDTGPEIVKTEHKRLESFLEVLTASTIEFRLGLQPSRVLKKYRARKEAERLSDEKWLHLDALVPDRDRNDPIDDEILRQAKATIGDYKLRTDPTYVSTDERTISLSKKYEQVLNVREELNALRSNYNKEVFRLRHIKQQLLDYIRDRTDHLKMVQREIAEHLRMEPPKIRMAPELLEYPERGISSSEPVHFESRCDKQTTEKHWNFVTTGMRPLSVYIANEQRYKQVLRRPGDHSLLSEFVHTRLEERVFEQRHVIDDMNRRVERFDREIHRLRETRLQIELRTTYLESFLLTLFQELWVLRDFKQLEDKLLANVNEQIVAQNDIGATLTDLKNTIEQHRKNIDQGNADVKLLNTQFVTMATGNRFWDFLRKAYRRKYRAPRRTSNADFDLSSESSDESSSSDEDDARSLDSADIGPVHLDENVCPSGCDRSLYDSTFELRRRRHSVEAAIKDEHAAIETCNKRIVQSKRQQEVVERQLAQRNGELTKFVSIKQTTLNEIDTMVILKMSQMQYYVNRAQFSDIDNTILFDNESIANLYARVADLEVETMRAREQHRVNVTHLSRMKTDCRRMDALLAELSERYEIEMMTKFGMKVDLDELEEGVLKRMVYDIRANTSQMQKEYKTKASELRSTFAVAQERLKCVVEQEIEKLNVLTILQEEHNWLSMIAANRKGEQFNVDNSELEKDVAKLSAIAAQQQNEIALFTNEIAMLRMKAKPFMDISQPHGHEPILMLLPEPHKALEEFTDLSNRTLESSGRSLAQKMHINQLIESFFEQHLHNRLSDQKQKELAQKIIEYFASLTYEMNNPSDHRDIHMTAVVEKFQQLMPDELMSHIPVADVAQLLQSCVAGIIQHGSHNTLDVTPEELMRSILEETYDSMSAKDSKSTQSILTQALKNLIVDMSIDDIRQPKMIAQLVHSLSIVAIGPITPDSVDTVAILRKVMSHGEENYVDDLSADVVMNVINYVVDGLVKDSIE